MYYIISGGRIRYSFGLGEGEVVLIWFEGGRYGTHLVWGPCDLFMILMTLMILMFISNQTCALESINGQP